MEAIDEPLARAGLLVVCVAALTLAGCGSIGPGRSASGKTASKQLNTAGVTRLEVGSAFDVRVTLGQPETATVTYDDNLADLLDVGVDSGTLRIQLKPHASVRNRPTLRAAVTVARLEGIQAAGASAVTVSGRLGASGLRLEVSGASRIAAELGLDRANATVSTRVTTNRSPGGPPRGPSSPLPATRIRVPSRTPGGTLTR